MPGCTHIVPRLPPAVDGVGDFGLRLATALHAHLGGEGRLLVGDPAWQPEIGATGASGIQAAALPERTAAALATALEGGPETALLHYVGYGYAARGCPTWLADGIASWLDRASGRRRLITVFHEVFAKGPPWTSSFWLSGRQRRLAARLARRSSGVVTSLQCYRELLERWVPAANVRVLPVFSTIGEPQRVGPLTQRAPRLVVFGAPGNRQRAYTAAGAELLGHACRELGLHEIVDVGRDAAAPARVAGIPVRAAGTLPDHAVGELLADSVAGFVAYPPDFLPKSTTFATYCAHGVVPVCPGGRQSSRGEPLPPHWGIRSGESLAEPQRIADAARSWYGSHALPHHLAAYSELLA